MIDEEETTQEEGAEVTPAVEGDEAETPEVPAADGAEAEGDEVEEEEAA